MGVAFETAYDRASPYTMTSRERMFALWQATQHVCRSQVPGDIVECGVWRGGSSMLATLALLDIGERRPVWLYDTFEGMTPPTERDRRPDGTSASDLLALQQRQAGVFNDWAYATLDDVQRQMASVGYPDDLLRYVRGPVEQTIPGECPASIAVLRLDTDWYESTRHELEHMWPRLSVGGVLIVDDYGHFEGAREATDEYFAAQSLPVLLHRIDYTARIAVK